jgi:hypothetical protein
MGTGAISFYKRKSDFKMSASSSKKSWRIPKGIRNKMK